MKGRRNAPSLTGAGRAKSPARGSSAYALKGLRRTKAVDRRLLDTFLGEVDCVGLTIAGENLILDIVCEEVESEDWDDGSGWLAALSPLRADVLGGDLRLFYLLWLTAVEADIFEPDEQEPLPGIGPMTGALEAFADFLDIDHDLVAAAAERSTDLVTGRSASSEAAEPIIAAMIDQDKTSLLARLYDGDTFATSELRALVRRRLMSEIEAPLIAARTVGELRARAKAIRLTRERAQADKIAAERKRREVEAERSRRARLHAIARRGESVWRDIEAEIERRTAAGYDKAAGLLIDLRAIAEEKGATEDFVRRLQRLRERHARKERFVERLAKLG